MPKSGPPSPEPTWVVMTQHQPGIFVFQICPNLPGKQKLCTLAYRKNFLNVHLFEGNPMVGSLTKPITTRHTPPVFQPVSFCISLYATTNRADIDP